MVNEHAGVTSSYRSRYLLNVVDWPPAWSCLEQRGSLPVAEDHCTWREHVGEHLTGKLSANCAYTGRNTAQFARADSMHTANLNLLFTQTACAKWGNLGANRGNRHCTSLERVCYHMAACSLPSIPYSRNLPMIQYPQYMGARYAHLHQPL